MDHANGLYLGDRNRNARLTRLRTLVPAQNAIAAIHLAGEKQMLVVTSTGCWVQRSRVTGRCQ